MSVLIKGMDMPKNDSWVNVRIKEKDGKPIIAFITGEDLEGKYFEIEEIPTPHGRLIDADTLANRIKNNYCNKCTAVEECGICVCQNCGVATLFDEIENSTTIIEAEVSE